MSVVNNILCHKPDEWTNVSYQNKSYQLVKVDNNSVEFRTVLADFQKQYPSQLIDTIHRIQSPYLFGLFYLRKEQLKCRYGTIVRDHRIFKAIPRTRLDELMQANFDTRKSYGGSDAFIAIRKNDDNDQFVRNSDSFPEYLLTYSDDIINSLSGLKIY